MPGPRAAGRAAWRVQAFCLRQNLGGGGIHFRRAFISNGVPAGRQPCGAVLPWSTWAMMATFLKCSFCISSISFSSMARPRGAPRRGARRMARTSVLPAAKPWRRRNSFPPSIYIKRGPRRASALWGGLAVVDVGDDGDIPQMFVLHIFNLLFSMARPRGAPHRGAHLAADQHTQPPCRLPDSGRRSRFAHSFALYAVLSFFASHSSRVFQKKPPDFAIFMEKRPPKRRCSAVSDNFPGFPEK